MECGVESESIKSWSDRVTIPMTRWLQTYDGCFLRTGDLLAPKYDANITQMAEHSVSGLNSCTSYTGTIMPTRNVTFSCACVKPVAGKL